MPKSVLLDPEEIESHEPATTPLSRVAKGPVFSPPIQKLWDGAKGYARKLSDLATSFTGAVSETPQRFRDANAAAQPLLDQAAKLPPAESPFDSWALKSKLNQSVDTLKGLWRGRYTGSGAK